MATYTIVTSVPAAPEVVFTFLSSPKNHERLHPLLHGTHVSSDVMHDGVRTVQALMYERNTICCIPYDLTLPATFVCTIATRSIWITTSVSGVGVDHYYNIEQEGQAADCTLVTHRVVLTLAARVRCLKGYIVKTAKGAHEALDKRLVTEVQ